jgi:hypothetical protein
MAPSPIDSDVSTFKLGGTLTIPRLGFGAMQLPGRPNGPAVDQAMAVAVARRAVELGVRHLDTAAFYVRGGNRANDILWRALHPYPADLTIATKVGPLRTSTGEMYGEARPEQLRSAVERNLRELGVDVLDLVYLRVGRLREPSPGREAAHCDRVPGGHRLGPGTFPLDRADPGYRLAGSPGGEHGGGASQARRNRHGAGPQIVAVLAGPCLVLAASPP